jgi:sugar/nucleoside kinase (ribokinase family)
MPHREGFTCAGYWSFDNVRSVGHYPAEGQLAFILAERRQPGGGAYQVCRHLRALSPELPLYTIGVVGEDEDGHAIHTFQLCVTNAAVSAHTEIVVSAAGGVQTCFHFPGANDLLGREHFDFRHCLVRWLHVSDFNMLTRLMQREDEFDTAAAAALHEARAAGLNTSMSLSDHFSPGLSHALPATLPEVDYLVISESQAQRLIKVPTRDGLQLSQSGMASLAGHLLSWGVRVGVAIVFPVGGFYAGADGRSVWLVDSSSPIEKRRRSATECEAAFCAGFLYGRYCNQPIEKCLEMAVNCARK